MKVLVMMMNKILKTLAKFFKGIYKVIDKVIVTPISKIIYIINQKLKGNSGKIEKFLNKPNILLYMALVLAVGIFFLVDSRVITLVQTEAEILVDQPLTVKYNKEAYVIEGLPEAVDITLIGRNSDLYLAKQLGDHEVILDLTDYEEGTYKVRLTLNKTIDSLNYKLDPGTVTVVVKKRVSTMKTIDSDLLNQEKLDSKLSVSSVELSRSEVVVKGSEDALAKVASVKALIDLDNKSLFTGKGTFLVDNVPLVAYDSSGNVIKNVDIVHGVITATVKLDSYSVEVPLKVFTTGELLKGRAISSLLINGGEQFMVTIYGDQEALDAITYIPVTIDVTNQGSKSKTYPITLVKPSGVRYISESNATIVLEFGEEIQKTISGVSITSRNVREGLRANANSEADQVISVQVKGVQSVIDKIDETNINAYVDLTNYGIGTHDVKVEIETDDPKVAYVALRTVTIRITAK